MMCETCPHEEYCIPDECELICTQKNSDLCANRSRKTQKKSTTLNLSQKQDFVKEEQTMELNINVQGTVKVVLDTAFDIERLLTVLTPVSPGKESESKSAPKPAEKTAKKTQARKAEETKTVYVDPDPEPAAAEIVEKEPLSESEVTELRKSVANYIHADESNKAKVKDWLSSHNLRRVPDITKDLLDEFYAFLGVRK